MTIKGVAEMDDLSELERVRQKLALDSEEGKPGAVEALERIEARIAEIRRAQERGTLASTERTRRAAVDDAARAERERRALEAAHAANDKRYRAVALEVGRAVVTVREQLKDCKNAVARGRILEPVRAAAMQLLDAATVASASAARLAGRRVGPVYGRTEMLLRSYTAWRLDRDTASLLFGPLGPAEAHPEKMLRESLARLFEGPDSR